jgi:hypothetical protein
MHRFFLGSLSALLLATAATPPAISAPKPMLDSGAFNKMEFSFTAPFISSSALLNNHHIIRIMVVGMSLEDVRVSIPQQMSRFDKVQVLDGAGRAIPAKITASREQVAIAFNQPVESGMTFSIVIDGLQTELEEGETLLYGVTAKRTGLTERIPIGTARIQVPARG